MSIFVYLTVLASLVNCVGMIFSSFEPYHIVVFALGAIMGAVSMAYPGRDRADGRATAGLAIAMAVIPLLRDPIRQLKYTMRERAYARQIQPLFGAWRQASGEAGKSLAAQFARSGAFPSAAQGALSGFPADPFDSKNAPPKYWTDGKTLWALVSVGPNKRPDLEVPPSPGAGSSADRRARWLALNSEDPRRLLYDPTNGSLGAGDLVEAGFAPNAPRAAPPDAAALGAAAQGASVHGAAAQGSAALGSPSSGSSAPGALSPEAAQFFRELGECWDQAASAIAAETEGATPCRKAAAAARKLLERGLPAAALAAASISVANIPPMPKDQAVEDYAGRLLQGRALYQLGDPAMAVSALATFLDLNPNDPEGHYWAGCSLAAMGDKAQARREFAAASQIDSRHPLARPAWDALDALTRGQPPSLPPMISPPAAAPVSQGAPPSPQAPAASPTPATGAIPAAFPPSPR